MVRALRAAGAAVIEVPVYRWVPPEDTGPLERLVQLVSAAGRSGSGGAGAAAAEVDAVAFTSAPAAVSFLRTARELGCYDNVRAALLGPVMPACVGPVTAGPFELDGIPVIQPARARLGALVKEIAEQVPLRRGQ
jgi:uroporphyrinogen-III synthase